MSIIKAIKISIIKAIKKSIIKAIKMSIIKAIKGMYLITLDCTGSNLYYIQYMSISIRLYILCRQTVGRIMETIQ